MTHHWLIALVLLLATAGQAAIEIHEFEDPVKRERYREFIAELRCPKCQNQNLAGSDAPIAQDLRRELVRMLDEGRTDAEISAFMVERYGDFVSYRPPLNLDTALLWAGPLLMLLAGVLIVARLVRNQWRQPEADTPLSPTERARAEQLMGGDGATAAGVEPLGAEPHDRGEPRL